MKRLFCLVLAVIFIFAPLQGALSADPLEDINQQIKEKKDAMQQLEDKINVYKKDIDHKQTEGLSLKNQMALLNSRIAKTELDIQMAEVNISTLDLEIKSLDIEIKAKEQKIQKQRGIIATLLRLISVNDQKSYIKILLSSGSFSEYFDQIKYLENVNAEINRSLQQIKADRAELEAKQKIAQTKKDKMVEVKKTLVERRGQLTEQKEAKNYLLAQTKLSENKFKTLLAQLRQEYSSFDQEVAALQRRIEKELAQKNKLETGEIFFAWPVPTDGGITVYFHDPTYPFRFLFEHSGLDIRVSQGTPVKAVAAGYVAWVRYSNSRSGYGNNVMIIHNNGIATLYAHLSRINITEGDFIERGAVLGNSGGLPGTPGAGFSTGPHLHFEVRENGLPVDPLGYLSN